MITNDYYELDDTGIIVSLTYHEADDTPLPARFIPVENGSISAIGCLWDGTTVIRIQSKINEDSLDYLASTDWYITRKFETGVAIPQDVLIKRQDARQSIINTPE